MPEVLQKSWDWHVPPRARSSRPVPRFVLHVRCRGCGAGFYGSAPLVLPPCPGCGTRALMPCCTWDLTASAQPPCLAEGEARP